MMKLDRIAAAIAAGAFSVLAAAALSSASALPLSPGAGGAPAVAPAGASAALPDAQIELAHGCHRGIQRDYSGWHFHTGACLRRNTAPPGLYDRPAYRRYYRGPLCSYRCKYVGPVKTCTQVCR